MDFLVSTEDSTNELMMWKQPKKTHVYKRGRLPRSVYGQTDSKPDVIKKVRLYSQFLGELNLLDRFFPQNLVVFLFNYETN